MFVIILLNFVKPLSFQIGQDRMVEMIGINHYCYLTIHSDNWIFAKPSAFVKKRSGLSTDSCATPQGTALGTEVLPLTLLLLALECMER